MDEVWETERYQALMADLVAGWDAHQHGKFEVRRDRDRRTTAGQFAVVFGLSAHAHNMARMLQPLVERGLPTTAVVLARAIYECGITAQWVAQVPDGGEAITNKGLNSRRTFRDTMLKVPHEVFQEGAKSIAHADDPLHDSDSDARSFETICLDLEPGGHQAYVYYRAMSSLSHAGVAIADTYVKLNDEGRPELHPQPDETENDAYLHLVCASLVWAGRALDFFQRGSPRRSELRAAARELGVPDSLQLSEHYYQRTTTARRKRRP